jgi:hypothetical protein
MARPRTLRRHSPPPAAALASPAGIRWRAALIVLAGFLAAGVEFSQLWHTEGLDAFRRTTIGVLLIGRFFSWWDILSYWIGIAAIGLFDAFVSRPAGTER